MQYTTALPGCLAAWLPGLFLTLVPPLKRTHSRFICAGSVVPSLPAIVKETLNLVFNQAPIKGVDVYAGMASGWWGASMQMQAVGGIAALLGAFNIIAQEASFPSLGSFQPRVSIAGKLSGNGLPIAIGKCAALGWADWAGRRADGHVGR